MHADIEILEIIRQAFKCKRPEHFTDYTHCGECAEHDKVLRNRNLDTLCLEDLGTLGWDPIASTSREGFNYYFPALVRLALFEPEPEMPFEWYGGRLLMMLTVNGIENRRFLDCTPKQREAVLIFLRHLLESRPELLEFQFCLRDAHEAVQIWSSDVSPA